eukprot:805131-Pyramimonas_sp.AAC.2
MPSGIFIEHWGTYIEYNIVATHNAVSCPTYAKARSVILVPPTLSMYFKSTAGEIVQEMSVDEVQSQDDAVTKLWGQLGP